MEKTNNPGFIKRPKFGDEIPAGSLKVNETGEPIPLANSEDPDIIPPIEDELEITPPYEPPVPGEGP